MRNGWQVAIDMTEDGEENINIINSKIFETEEQADDWYRHIDSDCYPNLDFIMIHWINDEIEDTYLI